jgi:hypothetical protein
MDGPDYERHAVAFFDDVFGAFTSAGAVRGIVEQSYRVGGRRLCLRFAGSALVSTMSSALAHRLDGHGESRSDLTVCLWDSASTGCQMPRAALMKQTIRGEIDGINTSRIYAVGERGYPGITLFDRVRRLGLYWVPEVSALPEWVRGAPLRLLFHWWMSLHGGQLVHGAAVGTTLGGVLISARGGSGKSTSALACLAGGMQYAGDDYVLLELTPSPHVSNVYATAKVAASHLERFPRLAEMVTNPGALEGEKALIFLDRRYATQLADSLPLRAVLVPRVTGLPDTTVRRTSPASALAAIAPSTVLFHPRGGDHELQLLGQLVRAVPTYVLECGTDLAQISYVISTLLQELTHDGTAIC